MHLKRISQLGLLDPLCIEPHVLETFPDSVARGLVKNISEMVLGSRRGQNKYTTSAHIDWLLQVLAHGFALPLTDASLIESCVMIYSQWLLELHTRPAYLATVSSEEEQHFIRRLLLHMSQIFDFHTESTKSLHSEILPEDSLDTTFSSHAAISAGTVQRYVDLCKHVTALYASIGRALGPKMEPDTWKTLLSCLLGAIDNLIGHNGLASNQMLSSPAMTLAVEVLCDPLLRTLMELWLRSKTRDAALWSSLTDCFKIWANKPIVIKHWNAVTLGLSYRLMTGLYDSNSPIKLSINTLNYNLVLAVDQASSGFLWYKFLFLLRSDFTLNATSLSLILQGIGQIVTVLSKAHSGLVPSGNTLLRIVGPWLFEACLSPMNAPNSSEGTEPEASIVALSVLCNIFTQRPFYGFASQYREILIGCLHQGLSQDTGLQAIFIYGNSLLGQTKIGLDLLPYFLEAVHKIVPSYMSGARLIAPIDQIRRGILYGILAGHTLPKRFPSAPTPANWPPPGHDLHLPPDIEYDGVVESFKDLTAYILQILFQFLSSETDPINFRLTLDLLLLHIAEASPQQKIPLSVAVLRATISQVLRSGSNIELTLICLEAVSRLIVTELNVAKEKIIELISTLSNYIIYLLDDEDFSLSEPILKSIYKFFAQWIAISDFKNPNEIFPDAFSVICRGLTVNEETLACRQFNPLPSQAQRGTLRHQVRSVHNPTLYQDYGMKDDTGYSSEIGRVSFAARLALNTLLYFQRPPSTFDDVSLAKNQLCQKSEFAVQYFFIVPDTLVAISEEPSSHQVTIVIRDSFGKMVCNASTVDELKWSVSNLGCPIPLASPIPPNSTPLRGHSCIDTVISRPTYAIHSNHNTEISATGVTHPLDSILGKIIESQKINETSSLNRLNRSASIPIIPPSAQSSHHLNARQFLLQLGVLSPHSSNAIPLPLIPSLIENIEYLDRLSILNEIPVTLLYSSSLGPPTLSPSSLPICFKELASHLRQPWKPSNSDPFVKIELNCPYVLSEDAPFNHPILETFTQKSRIVIVYCDIVGHASRSQSPDFPSTLWSQVGGSFLLIITPESDNYFRVRLAGPDHFLNHATTPWIGPLSDDVLVSRSSLMYLVRSTVISMWMSSSPLDPSLQPHLAREACLSKISMIGQSQPSLDHKPDSQRYFSVLLRPTSNLIYSQSQHEPSSEQLHESLESPLKSLEPHQSW